MSNCVSQSPISASAGAAEASDLIHVIECFCQDGWNGGADFNDNRVFFNASSGNWVAISCPNSVTGQLVMYSLMLAFLMIRAAYDAFGLHDIITKRKDKPLSFISNVQFRILVFDFVAGTPSLVAMCCLKLATDQVIGTDVAVTFLCIFGFSCWILAWADFCISQFAALIKFVALGKPQMALRMLHVYKRATIAQMVVYILATGAPTFAMLFGNKSLGPDASNETTLLIIRNVGVILWVLSLVLGTRLSIQELDKFHGSSTLESSKETGAATSQQQHPTTNATSRVISFLRQQHVQVTIQAAFITCLYIVFTTPPFFGWQMYSLCITGVLTSFRSSPALVFIRSRAIAHQGIVTSPIHSHREDKDASSAYYVPSDAAA